ncbi:hypothetical protein BGX29_004785 [Mortierella sp. GBA35]|nr:hypothetical protein BGX29_004785 [Mortierella sp. GBA35]
MSLDLNVSWPSAAPAWTRLADGPRQSSFPAVFSADEDTLFAFNIPDSDSPHQYSVKNNAWQNSTAVVKLSKGDATGAVTDPRTGLVYMAAGYVKDGGENVGRYTSLSMDVFDPITQRTRRMRSTVPDRTFPVMTYYENVWCKERESILYFGGGQTFNPARPTENVVSEFKTDSLAWSILETVVGVHGP